MTYTCGRMFVFNAVFSFPSTFLLPKGSLWQDLVDANIVIHQNYSMRGRLISLKYGSNVQHCRGSGRMGAGAWSSKEDGN